MFWAVDLEINLPSPTLTWKWKTMLSIWTYRNISREVRIQIRYDPQAMLCMHLFHTESWTQKVEALNMPRNCTWPCHMIYTCQAICPYVFKVLWVCGRDVTGIFRHLYKQKGYWKSKWSDSWSWNFLNYMWSDCLVFFCIVKHAWVLNGFT